MAERLSGGSIDELSCPGCGSPKKSDDKLCIHCGSRSSGQETMDQITCAGCGCFPQPDVIPQPNASGQWLCSVGCYDKFKASKVVYTPRFCSTCGTVVNPRYIDYFNGWLAAVLFLFFLWPGLLYLVYCFLTKRTECPRCSGRTLIPVQSPLAGRMLSDLGEMPQASDQAVAMSDDTKLCPFCAEVIKAQAVLCKHCRSSLAVDVAEPDAQ
jgi:hypothetical protein